MSSGEKECKIDMKSEENTSTKEPRIRLSPDRQSAPKNSDSKLLAPVASAKLLSRSQIIILVSAGVCNVQT